jgi:hypothetical protein
VRGLLVVVVASVAGLGPASSAVALPAGADSPPAGCPSAPAGGFPHAPVPTGLAELEQKMQHLTIRTVQFSEHLDLEANGSSLDFTSVGESRRSPAEGRTTTKVVDREHSGARKTESMAELQIGLTLYTYEPTATHGDGGRPWVRTRLTRKQAKEQGPAFPDLIGPFDDAQSIEEAGSATRDGHSVEQFNLTFAPGEYPSSKLPFGTLLTTEACAPPVEVSVSIDPSGLPVLTRVSATYQHPKRSIAVTTTLEIPAINGPFAPVKPPPANKTIGAAALRKFEEKRVTKALRKLRRQARKRHPKPHRA